MYIVVDFMMKNNSLLIEGKKRANRANRLKRTKSAEEPRIYSLKTALSGNIVYKRYLSAAQPQFLQENNENSLF